MFNSMYAIKLIDAGQTRAIKTVRSGAGFNGNAAVLQASKGARFQLVDVVTQASPERLNMKRIGDALHIALPGGDIENPDIIIKDYYTAEGAQLQGASVRGEWQTYATHNPEIQANNADGVDAAHRPIQERSAKLIGFQESGVSDWLHDTNPWLLGAGGLALLAAAGGASSKSSKTVDAPATALETLKNFTADTAAIGSKTAATPTLQNYTDLGIKAYASLTDTSDSSRVALTSTNTNLAAINNAIDQLDASSLTKEKVQALVDAYYRILKEADGNTEVNTDVYVDTTNDANNAANHNDPTAADYAAVGAKIGTTTHALNLLNDAVGRQASTAVDTIEEINALAKAAENVMLWAAQDTNAGDPSATSAGPATYTTDADWVNGLSRLGITGLSSTLIADIKTALKAAANDGSTVDTVKELQDLINPIVSLKILNDYTADTGAIGSKTAATPTLTNWASLTQTSTSLSEETRIKLDESTYWKTTNPTNALSALNSALDTYTSVDKDQLQAIVDSYGRILQEADGNRFVNTDISAISQNPSRDGADLIDQDLVNIGVKITNTANITDASSQKHLLRSVIGNLRSTSVDTVEELNALATVADNIMRQAKGLSVTYTDTDWGAALNSLGITGMTSSNITHIKNAIDAAQADNTVGTCDNIDTYAELQSIVSLTRVKDHAELSTNTAPTIEDYQYLARGTDNDTGDYNIAKSANLAAYNDIVNSWNSATAIDKSSVQNMVTSYNTVLELADGNRGTTTPVVGKDVYEALIGTGTLPTDATAQTNTVKLLTNVIDGFSRDKVDTVNELIALAQTSTKIMELAGTDTTSTSTSSSTLQGTTTLTFTRAELAALGLTDGANHAITEASGTSYWVTDAELTYFRNTIAQHADNEVNTLTQLQTFMQQAMSAVI